MMVSTFFKWTPKKDTQRLLPPPIKPQRCQHTLESKAQVLAAFTEPDASVAVVAQRFNIKVNLIASGIT